MFRVSGFSKPAGPSQNLLVYGIVFCFGTLIYLDTGFFTKQATQIMVVQSIATLIQCIVGHGALIIIVANLMVKLTEGGGVLSFGILLYVFRVYELASHTLLIFYGVNSPRDVRNVSAGRATAAPYKIV
uniref:Uncharacterized protein n=1 Tax=Caulerpa cliftonii TaxID=1004391 RepID=A0A1C9JBK9_9CHLO|nr:hypothetical protein [Caulerpa cliftonii]AOP19239.1 hypothetical protein [Caulerpa cliftonii]